MVNEPSTVFEKEDEIPDLTPERIQTVASLLTIKPSPEVMVEACDLLLAAAVELDRVRAERDEALRGGLAAGPTNEGGPGHEQTYWLRSKLRAAIMHLRDVEDYYRMLGGRPESHNQARADRARDIYEQITEDFVNGKLSVPSVKAERDALRAENERLRAALGTIADMDQEGPVENWKYVQASMYHDMRALARAALNATEKEA